jgi:hypothetical protein
MLQREKVVMANTKTPTVKPSSLIRAGKDSAASQRSNSASAIVMGPEVRLKADATPRRGTSRK